MTDELYSAENCHLLAWQADAYRAYAEARANVFRCFAELFEIREQVDSAKLARDSLTDALESAVHCGNARDAYLEMANRRAG